MSNERYLIITADDFGLCRSMNEAIIELWEARAITSSVIMMPEAWAGQAAEYAAQHRDANIGIHLTLKSGFLQKASDQAVSTEIRSQIEAAIQSGIDPTHLDSHEGSLLGLADGRDFLELVFDLCEEYRLPFKLPRNIVHQPFFSGQQRKLFRKRIDSADRRCIPLIDELIILPYEHEPGEDYPSVKRQLSQAIRDMRAGITELVVHPARDTAEMRTITPHSAKRELEFRLCMDEEFRKLVADEGIQLISWREVRDGMRLGRTNT
ncbi:ChbG/HpnK family deacetylase [Paenibacillus sp. MMS20-IR301]|uniref:ChbG/HpnK family deacetylase n=1 Tax=Paenibacillus sp. MMS20-IR301 TaxID=2895946 RepID=UPI0028E83930|nr:ChbG/HpnK family deacetylase [Paenibacillus sp. MMS20-IR301]WNS41043.1 ChbG/HpnK family deacetylase [Paenibacillus sp. MMS20-IR301]